MEPLITLIDRWTGAEADAGNEIGPSELTDKAQQARHALELRIAELTGYADALRLMGSLVGDKIHRRIVGQVVPDGNP